MRFRSRQCEAQQWCWLNKDHPLASPPPGLKDNAKSVHRAKPSLTPQTGSREQGPDLLLSRGLSEELTCELPHASDDRISHHCHPANGTLGHSGPLWANHNQTASLMTVVLETVGGQF